MSWYRAVVVTIVILAGSLAHAEGDAPDSSFAVGERLPSIELEDQNEIMLKVDETTKFVLFSRDMEGGGILKEALEDFDSDPLAGVGAVYLSDVSGMPRLIARMFALPSMRRRAYPMLLDWEGTATARIPARDERATVILLDRFEIIKIEYVDSPEQVRALIGIGSPDPQDP